jgi:hypothetical protein
MQQAQAQKLVKAEYFFNTDPGVGNGKALTIVSDTIINATFNISTTGLAAGFNQLFIRVQDSLGNWGIAEQRQFFVAATASKITACEYFFDTDPGAGLGKTLSVTSADSINTTENIGVKAAGISGGFHQLFIRFKDNLGDWGIAEQRTVFLDSTGSLNLAPLVGGEYLVTIDSGVGKGRVIPIAKADSINQVFNLVIPSGLPLGNTTISIRVKDSTGKWSIAEARTMNIVCKPNLGNDTTVKICPGAHTNITGLYSYKEYASSSWSTPRPDSVGVGTDTLFVTSSLGCSDTAVVTITNYPKPNLGKDTTTKICPGTFTTIKGFYDTTTYATVSWSVNRPDSVPIGVYKLYVSNQYGCRDTAVINVSAYPKPNLGNDTVVQVCLGSGKNLLPVYKLSNYTVQWSTPRPDSAAAGSYTLIVTNTNGCKDTAVITVTNYPKPNLGADTTVTICPGKPTNITGVYNVAGLTVHWSTPSPDSVGKGMYTLIVTNANGCKDTAVVTVATNPKPVLGADSAVTVCPGTAVNIDNFYKAAGLTKTWNVARPDSVTVAGTYTLIAANTYGCTDTAMVTINNYAKPSLGNDTTVSVCAGSGKDITMLYNVSSYSSVQWSTARPDSVGAGVYSLTVTNSNGCKDTALITVHSIPLPVTPVITLTRSATFCTGDSAILSAANYPGAPAKISWLKNSSVIGGQTTTQYSAKTTGNYQLRYTSAGCSSTSVPQVITVAGTIPPVPTVTKTGNTTFCLGDSLILTASASANLQWFRNNTAIKGATNKKYTVKIGGSYKVQVSGGGSCNSVSDSVVVTVNQVPKPTITLVNDTLVSSSVSGNQWFEGGTLIPGATDQKYPPFNIDAYTVQVTTGGCVSPMSDPFIYTANTLWKHSGGITGNMNIRVYPNPAINTASLQVTGSTGRAIISITDMAGKVLWQHDKVPDGIYKLPVGGFAAGMYLVTVRDEKHDATVKLVKSK